MFLILVHNIFFYFAIQSLRTEGIATDEKCESKMIRKTSLSGGKLVFLGDDLLFVECTCARNSPKSVHCAKWLGLALERIDVAARATTAVEVAVATIAIAIQL